MGDSDPARPSALQGQLADGPCCWLLDASPLLLSASSASFGICVPLSTPPVPGVKRFGVMLQFSCEQAEPLLGMTGLGSLCTANSWCQAMAVQPKSEQGSTSPMQSKNSATMALGTADHSFMASSCREGEWVCTWATLLSSKLSPRGAFVGLRSVCGPGR